VVRRLIRRVFLTVQAESVAGARSTWGFGSSSFASPVEARFWEDCSRIRDPNWILNDCRSPFNLFTTRPRFPAKTAGCGDAFGICCANGKAGKAERVVTTIIAGPIVTEQGLFSLTAAHARVCRSSRR
jgi:hypothetical protein